jgi:hypothetical protein
MSQTATRRYYFRTAPGAIRSSHGADPYESETMASPFVLQQLTITVAGVDPFAAGTTYTLAFPAQDGSGDTITVGPVTIALGQTLAQATVTISNAIAANVDASALYSVSNDGASVITLIARSANTSIAAASFTSTFADAHTGAVAQSVAASAPSLEMGLFYIYSASSGFGPGLTATPRGCRLGALPNSGTVIADLRGVIGRVVNQTTLATNLNSNGVGSSADAYPAGQTWPGLLRGTICARVDPASTSMDIGGQVHVVIAAGAYSVIGAVAAAADGGNTIRIDNAPTGNILGRIVEIEEDLTPFTRSSGRYVPLKVNRTN